MLFSNFLFCPSVSDPIFSALAWFLSPSIFFFFFPEFRAEASVRMDAIDPSEDFLFRFFLGFFESVSVPFSFTDFPFFLEVAESMMKTRYTNQGYPENKTTKSNDISLNTRGHEVTMLEKNAGNLRESWTTFPET